MDMMSYSYANRNILARISKILQNGQSDYWNKKAKEVQTKIKEYLWDAKRHACYDRDRDNKVMATNINWINFQKQFDCFICSERNRLLQKMLAFQIFGPKHLKYAPNPS